jgi:ABC-type antimicrobial peptide transport system permease subunit
MNSIDLIRMGLKNLWRRKLRTFLTVLGVIIGTASIIIMISLGLAMTQNFTNEISKMGSLNVINIYPNYGGGYYDGPVKAVGGATDGSGTTLDDTAVTKISQIQGVEAITPVLEAYYKLVSGRYAAQVSIRGIRPESMAEFEFPLQDGRLLQEGDTLNMVFGGFVPRNFYDTRASRGGMFWGGMPQEILVDVLNDRIVMTSDYSYGERPQPGQEPSKKKPKLYKINGVGILQEGNYENDYYAYMSIYELQKIVDETNKDQQNQPGMGKMGRGMQNQQQKGYQRVMVKVTDFQQVKEISQQIRDMGFQTNSLTDILDSMQKQYGQLQAILGGIGAVSLLVAAIGITNTMIMSIYERTKEIGVMKVIGAALSDIRRLFLLESGLIGLMGGIAGLGLSFLMSYILNTSGMSLFGGFGGAGPDAKMSVIPIWLVGYTMVFTTLVGILSGFYPARRAMKLSALEAIRTE